MTNPIQKLYQEGTSFKEMEEKTGLHLQTLYGLSRLTIEELITTIKLETAIKLYNGLGIEWGFIFDVRDKLNNK